MADPIKPELVTHVLGCDSPFCVEFRKALETLDWVDGHGCDQDSRAAAAILPFSIGHSCCPDKR